MEVVPTHLAIAGFEHVQDPKNGRVLGDQDVLLPAGGQDPADLHIRLRLAYFHLEIVPDAHVLLYIFARDELLRLDAAGRPADITGFPAVCDGAHYAGAGVAPLIHGASGAGLHGADGWVDADSVVETTQTFASAAIDYCDISG